MPVTSVTKDPAQLTLTVVADFPVTQQRLWDAYADPRQLERFWGPVEWPARFSRHDMFPGGRSIYTMTGPDGESSTGSWAFLTVDAPHFFEVEDGFAHDGGMPNDELPHMRMTFSFEGTDTGSRVTMTTHFGSVEDMQTVIGMGMEEGLRSAASQMDDVITDLASFATSLPASADILSDTQVRVARVIRGSVEQVWRAHHEPALLQRWLLGPDGWTMPVCEVALAVGDTYRYEWAREGGDDRFGFTGELLASSEPHRSVTTERMVGTDGPSTTNELTLTPVDGGTLLSVVITYPNAEVRDMILATGMTSGMETSYARLESAVLAPA